MANLQKFKPKICFTAVGFLIHDHKILLVKHKKLGIWLCPGGHIEKDELPHEAAIREFFEETGLNTKAMSNIKIKGKNSKFIPLPMLTNLHWISQKNFEARKENPENYQKEKGWGRGCEMHYNQSYLLESTEGYDFKQNIEETDGIAWFTLDEIGELETHDDIKSEIKYAFEVYEKH